jgi:hypothetical protein
MKQFLRLAVFSTVAITGLASAATMQSAVSASSNTEWSSAYDINNTINQSGLSSSYTNGITDFDSFVSSATHTTVASNNEWFAQSGVYSDSLIYDLGGSFNVSKIAIWNEESWGTDTVDIFASNDASFGVSTFLGSFNLTDNPLNISYLADVLDIQDTFAQYFKFNVVGSTPDSVALGEVAFGVSNISAVPVPTAALLFAPALIGFIGLRRKATKHA